MIKQGLSIHCHHATLLEYCYNYDERVETIKLNKPQNEQEIRLRLFKILPQEATDDLPERLVKAYADRNKADDEWKKADAERDKADAERDKADSERKKADSEWKKAYAERNKAYAEWNAEWKKADSERNKAYAEWSEAYTEWSEAYTEWQNVDQDIWHKKWCGCENWNNGQIDFSIK